MSRLNPAVFHSSKLLSIIATSSLGIVFSVNEVIQWELGSVNEPQLGLVEVAGVKGLICLYLVPQSIPCALHTFLYSNTLVLPLLAHSLLTYMKLAYYVSQRHLGRTHTHNTQLGTNTAVCTTIRPNIMMGFVMRGNPVINASQFRCPDPRGYAIVAHYSSQLHVLSLYTTSGSR